MKDRKEKVLCACGCGEWIWKYDLTGRERKYKDKHTRNGKTKDKIQPHKLTPEQKLETKLCECGCGTEILKYDKQYRERRFVNGHQTKGKNHPMLGRKHSEETKRMYSETRKGHKISETNRELTRQRNIENWQDEEYKERMLKILENNSDNNKGKIRNLFSRQKQSESVKGENHPNWGKELSEETKQKISESTIIRFEKEEEREKIRKSQNKLWSDPTYYSSKLGSGSPNWQGGITSDPYCCIWKDKGYKEEIRERDNYKCQNPDCWKKSEKICIHHIDYNKENCHPDNLITLCHSCNIRANYDRDYWQELYNKIIQNKKEGKENIYAVGY